MPGTPEIDEREQAASLARIEAGELPLAAEHRLKGLRDATGQGFTSDLSVAEFALGHELALQPLSQVMGSCIYQVGWQYGYGGSYNWDGSMFEELAVLTEAWNEARGGPSTGSLRRPGSPVPTRWWASTSAGANTTGPKERSSTW